MQNVRVTENPISGKILIGSTQGSILDAVPTACRYLNDPIYKKQDIDFYCDYGQTVITFPAVERQDSYTEDEVWNLICDSRGYKTVLGRKPESPGPA